MLQNENKSELPFDKETFDKILESKLFDFFERMCRTRPERRINVVTEEIKTIHSTLKLCSYSYKSSD
jgi:hypothetical protein